MKGNAALRALGLAWLSLAAPAYAQTAVGDWGHYVQHRPRVYLNNPTGQAFSVTLHVMQWPVEAWNTARCRVRLAAPDGAVLRDGELEIRNAEAVIEVPAGAPGVYRLETEAQPHWIWSTLAQSVLWTGEPGRDHAFVIAAQRRQMA